MCVQLYILLILMACQKNSGGPEQAESFEKVPQTSPLVGTINETSGIADSKANSGYLWAHEDSGNPPRIFLVKKDGNVGKSIYLKNALNRDWEDMAFGKGPDNSLNYLYVADIGDNGKVFTEYSIYRFVEPTSSSDSILSFDRIQFNYPDGSHDAEAMLLDNATRDIFIITKSDNPSKVYKLAYPQSTTSINSAVFVGQLAYGGVTSAAITPDGKEIIVKTYPGLSHYVRKSGQTIPQALTNTPVGLAYQLEPQGEAITFANDNSGFFTLSEKGFMPTAPNLYFYKRK